MSLHARFAEGIVRRRGLVISISSAIAIGALFLIRHLEFNPDVSSLLPKQDPWIEALIRYQGDLRASRKLIVLLRPGPAQDLEEAAALAAERLRASPLIMCVRARRADFMEAARVSLDRVPPEALDRLKARLMGPGRRAELEAAKSRWAEDPLAGKQLLLQDPLGLRWLLAEAALPPFPGKLRPGSEFLLFDAPPVALLMAAGRGDSFDVDFSKRLLDDVNARLQGIPARVELAGGYVSAVAQAETVRRDLAWPTALSGALVLGWLAWLSQSLVVPILLLLPVGFSILCGLALGGALLGPLTPLAVAVAAILIAQGIDFSIHLYSRCREVTLVEALTSMGRPFLGAATTTMAAFASLAFSGFPGIRQFGILLLLGFGICLLAAFTLLPALLTRVMPRRAAPSRSGSGSPAYGAALFGAIGVACWIAVAGGAVRVDPDLRGSLPAGDPSLAVVGRLESELGASLTPVFCASADWKKLESLRESGVIAFHVGGRIPAGDILTFRRETEGWVEGTLSDLRALGFDTEPFRKGLLTTQGLLVKTEVGPVSLFPARSLWDPGERSRFDAAVRAKLGEVDLYSPFHLPDRYHRLLVADMARVSGWAASAAVLLTLLCVGGVGDGLRALVPMIFAVGVTLALSPLLGVRINLVNMVAIPIVIGIGVDGGIHRVCRFRETGSIGSSEGILGSALTTLFGFGSLAFSSTPALRSMGLLVSVGVLASLAATLCLLPALICMRAAKL